MLQQQAGSVRLVGRRGAIQITRRPRGEVLVSLEGDRVDELLPRAAAELAQDLGRLQHLVVDATGADGAAHAACSRWADAHRDRATRVTFLAAVVDDDAASTELAPPRSVRGPVPTRPLPHDRAAQLRHA